MTSQEAKELIERVVKLSRADETTVNINGGHEANLRFARNEVSTSGDTSNTTVNVRCSIGKRSGAATVNQFDTETLQRAVRQAEETARFSPEDPELMPLLGPQSYLSIDAFDQATADTSPDYRAQLAKKAIDLAKSKNVVIAGFFTNAGRFQAIGNSKGNFGYHRSSEATFTSTARTTDGTGSGWAGNNTEKLTGFDPIALAGTAVDKAFKSAKPRQIPAGTYTVILEPAAVADLLMYMGFAMDARSADEGRSFFSKKGGGNKIGEKVLAENINVWSDPGDSRAPSSPFASELLPARKTTWIENGVVKNLVYNRFWASKQGKEPSPSPVNLIMKGGKGSVEDLIRGTKKGVLVTRLWYIRFVDPQTILLTGLTRDGTFLIENGKVRYPVKNFRFNDSPIAVLSKVEEMSREVRARGTEADDFPIVVPALRTSFTFSSQSEAV